MRQSPVGAPLRMDQRVGDETYSSPSTVVHLPLASERARRIKPLHLDKEGSTELMQEMSGSSTGRRLKHRNLLPKELLFHRGKRLRGRTDRWRQRMRFREMNL